MANDELLIKGTVECVFDEGYPSNDAADMVADLTARVCELQDNLDAALEQNRTLAQELKDTTDRMHLAELRLGEAFKDADAFARSISTAARLFRGDD